MPVYQKLLKLQANRLQVAKSCKANLGPGRVYSYASLDDVLAEAIPALNAAGLVMTQNVVISDQGGCVLVTKVIDPEDSSEFSSSIPLPPASKWHDFGSGVTYARRYSLCGLLGIASDEDDDANTAMQSQTAAKPANGTPKPPAAHSAPPKPMLRPIVIEFKDKLNSHGFIYSEADTLEVVWSHCLAANMGLNASTPATQADRGRELARILGAFGEDRMRQELDKLFAELVDIPDPKE